MTIPIDAIDPDAGYRQWVEQYLWHIDQLPVLLEAMLTLATPRVPSSKIGVGKITGGGYPDAVPLATTLTTTGDHPASTDADTLWVTLCAYLTAVSTHADEPAPLDPEQATWGTRTRLVDAGVRRVKDTAIRVDGWLADRVDRIVDWPDLSELEEQLFALIRRARGRYRSAGVRRARPRPCTVCGEAAVLIDWVDDPNGSARPVMVGRCRTCGQLYEAAT